MKHRIFALSLLVLALGADARAVSGGRSAAPAARAVAVSRAAPSIPSVPRAAPPVPSTTPRSYAQPAATVAPAAPATGGGGFWSSFAGGATGAAVGNLLTNSHGGGTTVVNAGAAPVAAGMAPGMAPGMVPGTTVVTQGGYGFGSFIWDLVKFVVGAIVLLASGAFLYGMVKKLAEKWKGKGAADPVQAKLPDDPLNFFYRVQQLAAVGDRNGLEQLCTPGLAMVLSRNPSNEDVFETLTGVYFQEVEDSIVYTFEDKKEAVTECWQFTPEGKLDGIEVV